MKGGIKMLNEYICIGRIVADPELRKTKNDESCVYFTLAVSRDNSEITDFPDFACYKKNAENLCKYIKKGDLISVVGTLRTRINENKKIVDIKAKNIYYLSNNKKIDINNFADNIEIPE
jgi:single-strand DNA-binding protein